jgi:hypothetical protein
MAIQSLQPPVSEESAYAKVAWRIIPLLFVCYICAYLDRVNVGFAKLQMQADIPGISDSVYGVGAGIFFFGYFLFEVPSNILMENLGARLFGPSIVGWITDWTKRSDYGLYVVAAAMVIGAVLVLFFVPRRTTREPV